MKRTEFLRELEIAMEDTMPREDIQLVLESYETMFYNGFLDGKEEEIITAELGSPARIVKSLLSVTEEEEAGTGDAVTKALTSRFLKTDPKVFGMALAPMGTRALASLFDAALITFMAVTLLTVPQAVYHMIRVAMGYEPQYLYQSAYYYIFGEEGLGSLISPFLILTFLGAYNVFTGIFVWKTNGYTPGKKLFHIKVHRLDGERMTLRRAFVREIGVKFLLNGITTGFLNGISLVWGFSTIDKKTVHDGVAKTVVISDFTKDELLAMSADQKLAKQKRRAKKKEIQQKRLAEKESQKQEKARERARRRQQPKPREMAKDEKENMKKDQAIAKARKRQDAAKEKARKKIEAEAARAAKSSERSAAIAESKILSGSGKNSADLGLSQHNEPSQQVLPEHQVRGRGLNAEELATIERIKANLEEQKRRTEEEILGAGMSARDSSAGMSNPEEVNQSSASKAESKGPTIIFKDHNE